MDNCLKPLVSIIIPTYNRGHILADAIDSVCKQTYPNKQIIVVDDGSVDNTRNIVSGYPEIQYIYQENGGQGKARNSGLLHAKGFYIASLDADDIWYPDFLEQCIRVLETNTLSFVFANWMQQHNEKKTFDFFRQTGAMDKYISNSDAKWFFLDNALLRDLYIGKCPSPSSSLVLKREAMYEKWNEQLHIADDWCLLLDMILLKEAKAAFTVEKLWTKRRDGQNIYDGRDNIEIEERLGIKDGSAILERYKTVLNDSEISFLNKNIARSIYVFYLRNLFKLKIRANNNVQLKKALASNPLLLGELIAKSVYRRLRRMVKH